MAAPGDNPIETAAEDVLGRQVAAKHLADELRQLDASRGAVVALMGPWGSGKTSMVNMVRECLQAEPALPILDFNPWMFSGAEQLVDAFFTELAAQLRLKAGRLKRFADELESYGELLSPLGVIPVVGSWISRIAGAGKALKKFEERRKESVTARRARLTTKATELEQSIVVVIDDIDRLNTAEIRDIFKLVRLTASLPNIIYLLAFDRKRVEDALTETGISGRSYLEKIVQIAFDIPAVPVQMLLRHLADELNQALAKLGIDATYNESRWPDVGAEIIRPLLRHMRDVRRYVSSVRGAVRALYGQVELVDLLGLEAVRVFLPDVFERLVDAQVALTNPIRSFGSRRSSDDEQQKVVESLLAGAGSSEAVVRAMISRLFPAAARFIGGMTYDVAFAATWLRERRVAHLDILRLYLERFANEGVLAFTDAERAFAMLGDGPGLDSFLRSIDPPRLADVVEALEVYEQDYPSDAVPPAVTVLLNLLPDIPEREQAGMYTIATRFTVTRVVLRLLRRITEPTQVEELVEGLWPRVNALSSRLELVLIVGHQQDIGHGLASEEAAERFEARILMELKQATPTQLAQSDEPLRMLIVAGQLKPGWAISDDVLRDPQVTKALLLDAYSEARSQSIDSRAVVRSPRLAWDSLVQLYGSDAHLLEAVDAMKAAVEVEAELQERLDLVDRYRSGWRPRDFGDVDSDG